MSQSSNPIMNRSIFSNSSAIMDDSKATATEAEKEKKRAASPTPPASQDQMKKQITDHHSYATKAENAISTSVEESVFSSAAEIAAKANANVQTMHDLSDEELLDMAIQIEKEHPQ